MSMRVGLVLVAVGGLVAWHFLHSRPPTAAQVEPLLRSYLANAHNCSGTLVIKQLDSVSVGEYVDQMGGWPVYANHVEECRDTLGTSYHSSVTTTYDGRQDAERNVAAAFARRTATGRVELYVPAVFQAGQREMQQALQKSLDSIKVN